MYQAHLNKKGCSLGQWPKAIVKLLPITPSVNAVFLHLQWKLPFLKSALKSVQEGKTTNSRQGVWNRQKHSQKDKERREWKDKGDKTQLS